MPFEKWCEVKPPPCFHIVERLVTVNFVIPEKVLSQLLDLDALGLRIRVYVVSNLPHSSLQFAPGRGFVGGATGLSD
jgi:hypothetical protein